MESESTRTVGDASTAGAIAALALAGIAFMVSRRFSGDGTPPSADKRHAAFVTYLQDHMAGANGAIHIVEQLAEQDDTRDEALFERLLRELREDRDVVSALLAMVGASDTSLKTLVGQAGGAVLRAATGGRRGELALFRSLEALSIGIQGKRCLWRVGQTLEPVLRAPGPRSFAELETRAIRQWDAVEAYRRSLATVTFGAERTDIGQPQPSHG
jgi:hypothetical protein